MRPSIVILSALLLAPSAFADDESDRAKLLGKWQQSDGNSVARSTTWALEGVGDAIRLTNSNGPQTVAEFECNTMGKECAVKDAGRPSKVSLWFNGPKLVELETKGPRIVKRRCGITGDGETLELETIPIVPAGKSEITHFRRVSVVGKQ